VAGRRDANKGRDGKGGGERKKRKKGKGKGEKGRGSCTLTEVIKSPHSDLLLDMSSTAKCYHFK